MIHPIQRTVCCLALLLWAGVAQATTYEVSPGGNDASAGTAGAPFKTLQKAASIAAAGDTVLVNDGTYAGFRVRTSGTAAALITFQAKNKWGAKISTPDPNGDVDLIAVLSASYVTIDGFEVTGASRAGIGVRTLSDETGEDTRNDIVQNCYSHDNGLPSGGAHDGIFTGFALNFTAQNNVCDHNGEHGIYISNSADNPVVRGNICSNNRSCGVQLNADASTQINGHADGLISNWLIEDNVIFGNGTAGGSAINLDGDIFGVCRNNLLYNNLATGIALYSIDGAEASHDNLIVGNTIYQPTSSRSAISLLDGANNNIVFNNILYTNPAHSGVDINAVSGFQHDYNFVSSISGDALSAHESSPAASTLFTNIAANDYHLKLGSPAIDSGVATFGGKSAPSDDLEGHSRPLGVGFDRGAYEAAGSAQTQPGVLQLSAQSYSIGEGAGTATITVARTGGSDGAVSVHYAAGGGTATGGTPSMAGRDYTSVSGTLSWAAGDANPKTFAIAINDDSAIENTETVGITLSTPNGGAALGAQNSATLSIVDNDTATPTATPKPTSTPAPTSTPIPTATPKPTSTPVPQGQPLNKGLSPANASDAEGVGRSFTASYFDPDGASNISYTFLRVGEPTGSAANMLVCCYNATTNNLYARNDADKGWLGGFAPGSANIISNAHGFLDCSQTTVGKTGNMLTVVWKVGANSVWAGTAQKLSLFVTDKSNLSDGYDTFGSWKITGNVTPQNVSLSPATASNAPNTIRGFTAKYSDANGWQNISHVLFKVGDNARSNANSLLCYYDVVANKLYLRNDANTAWLGGVAPGAVTTISNSQGSLDVQHTAVAKVGNDIAVKWSVKATSAFIGNHVVALYVHDVGSLFDGYDALGTWQIVVSAKDSSGGSG